MAAAISEDDESPEVYVGPGQKAFESLLSLQFDYMDRHYPKWRNYETPAKYFLPKTATYFDELANFERLLDRFQSPVMCYSLEDLWVWDRNKEVIVSLLDWLNSLLISDDKPAGFFIFSSIMIGPKIGLIAIFTCDLPSLHLAVLLDALQKFLELQLSLIDHRPARLPVRVFVQVFGSEKPRSLIQEWNMYCDGDGKCSTEDKSLHSIDEHDGNYESGINHLLEDACVIPQSLYEELSLRFAFTSDAVLPAFSLYKDFPCLRNLFPAVIRQIRKATNDATTYSCVIPTRSSDKTRLFCTLEQVKDLSSRRKVIMGAAGTEKTTAMTSMLLGYGGRGKGPAIVCAPGSTLETYKEFVYRHNLEDCEVFSWLDDNVFDELMPLLNHLRYAFPPDLCTKDYSELTFSAIRSFKDESYISRWIKAFRWLKRRGQYVESVFIDDALIECQNQEKLILSFTAILALISASKFLSINFFIAFDGTTKHCQRLLQNFGVLSIFQYFQEMPLPDNFDFSFTILPHVLRCPRNISEGVNDGKLFSDLAVIPSTYADEGPATFEIQKFCAPFNESLNTLWDAIIEQVNVLIEDGFRIHEIAILSSSDEASKEEANTYFHRRWECPWVPRCIGQRVNIVQWRERNINPDISSANPKAVYEKPGKPCLIFHDRDLVSLEWPAVIHARLSSNAINLQEKRYLDFLKYRFESRAMIKLISITVQYNAVTKETRMEQYRQMEFLGRGASGDVFKFMHKPTETAVAVKIIKMADGTMTTAAWHEADLLRKVSHPNIISMLGVIEDIPKRQLWLIMDLANGGSLRPYCTGNMRGQLTAHQKIRLGVECLSALRYLHDARISHQDLKPDNVLLHTTEDGVILAKICDFGIAKIKDHLSTTEETSSFGGTVIYMPPEPLMGQRNAALADVYAIGATLIELFTGFFFWHCADTQRRPDPRQVLLQLTDIRRRLSSTDGLQAIDTENQAVRCATSMLNRGANHCGSDIENILKRATSFDRRNRPTAAQALDIFIAAIQTSSAE